ncbi:hypothetical protein BH20VER3_BH20VER3_14320 [soil metagenome]
MEGSEIFLQWDKVELATRCRFRGKIVGVETQYRLTASSVTPLAVVQGIEAGLTLEIIAQALNGGSRSAASPVFAMMPAVQQASAPATLNRSAGSAGGSRDERQRQWQQPRGEPGVEIPGITSPATMTPRRSGPLWQRSFLSSHSLR